MATNYYVDGAVGADINLGTSEGLGNAWATIHYACSNIVAGDTIYVKASATYGETVTIGVNGAAANPIILEGYTSTPGDGGKITVDGADTRNDGFVSVRDYWVYRNIIVQDCLDNGWDGAAMDYSTWDNCEANGNNDRGFYVGQRNVFKNCKVTGSGIYGMHFADDCVVVGCEAWDNGTYNYFGRGTSSMFYNCLSVGASQGGFVLNFGGLVSNCTVDGKNATFYGIYFVTGAHVSVAVNNIAYDCVYGIRHQGTGYQSIAVGASNLMYSNTINYQNWPLSAQASDITGVAPGFTDEAGGDYTLAAASGARNVGSDLSGDGTSDGMDVGCFQSEDAGGEGGDSRIILTT